MFRFLSAFWYRLTGLFRPLGGNQLAPALAAAPMSAPPAVLSGARQSARRHLPARSRPKPTFARTIAPRLAGIVVNVAVAILLDCSPSMAGDLRAVLEAIVRRLLVLRTAEPNNATAVIAWSGTATVVVPMTRNRDLTNSAIGRVLMVAVGDNTCLAPALTLAMVQLGQVVTRHRTIVVYSDGQLADDYDTLANAPALRKAHIRVFAIAYRQPTTGVLGRLVRAVGGGSVIGHVGSLPALVSRLHRNR